MMLDKKCSELTQVELADLQTLFASAFDGVDADEALERYLGSVQNVLIMYREKSPVAFLFYQILKLDSVAVLHFSLSGKVSSASGVQKRLGSYLFARYLLRPANIFRLNLLVTVSNNPRSYLNMRGISQDVFPDVLAPCKPCKHAGLYRQVATSIGPLDVDDRGIIRNRMADLGFGIRKDQADLSVLDDRGKAFMHYIDNDVSHGVLVMAAVTPARDVPVYYAKLLFKWLASRSGFSKVKDGHVAG